MNNIFSTGYWEMDFLQFGVYMKFMKQVNILEMLLGLTFSSYFCEHFKVVIVILIQRIF